MHVFFLFRYENGGYSLFDLVVKVYVFGTKQCSLPRLWNLGKQYFSQKTASKVCC